MPIARNAKIAAITLLVGAISQIPASLLGALSQPWAFAGWLVLTFGALGLCDELGATRPLNRAGLIMLGIGFVARTVMVVVPDPAVIVRAELAFAFSSLLALQLWSAALMHRRDRPKVIGILGSLLSASGLAVLIAAHVLAAGAGYLGFAELFSALQHPDLEPHRAMVNLATITVIWCGITGVALWTRDLKGLP